MVVPDRDIISQKIGKFVANLRVGCSVISMNFVSFALEATCSLILLV